MPGTISATWPGHVTRTGAGAARRSAHGPLVAGCGALRDGDAVQAVQRRDGTTDVSEDLQKPAPAARGASKDLQRIVGRCLAKDPAERYQSAAELARDFDRCAARWKRPSADFARWQLCETSNVSPFPRCSRSPLPLALLPGRCRRRRCRRWARKRPCHGHAPSPIRAATSRHINWPPRPSSTLRPIRTRGSLAGFFTWLLGRHDAGRRGCHVEAVRRCERDVATLGADTRSQSSSATRAHPDPSRETGYQPLEVAASAAVNASRCSRGQCAA